MPRKIIMVGATGLIGKYLYRELKQLGDEVIIFGDEYPVTEFAKNLGTIPYEILTGISRRVKRIYFYE